MQQSRIQNNFGEVIPPNTRFRGRSMRKEEEGEGLEGSEGQGKGEKWQDKDRGDI